MGLVLGLCRQRCPLLHSEAVLLIDHHEPEVCEPDVLRQQRMGADDDSRVSGRDGLPYPATVSGGEASRQQRHLRGLRVGLQGSGHPEPTEQRGDGCVMLLGQHLGGGQQRRLASRIDDREHGAQGHEGLSRTDLPLQQAMHRAFGGQFIEKGLPHFFLACGQPVRQGCVEGGKDPVITAGSGCGGTPGQDGPARGHGQLHSECLVELQPSDSALCIEHVDGFVNLSQGVRETDHPGPFRHPGGQRISQWKHMGQSERYRVCDFPGDHLRRSWVKTDQPSSLNHLDHRGLRVGLAARDRAKLVDDDVVGMSELKLPPEFPHLADEDATGARGELIGPVLRVVRAFLRYEESRLQFPFSVGQHGRHPGSATIHDSGG